MTAHAEIHKNAISEAVTRLIGRAADARSLKAEDLTGRVTGAVEKYVLRDDPDASRQEIREFVDALNADDLCLIVACERGDEAAWSDLVAQYDATVKHAARRFSSNNEDADDLASSIWAELYGLKEKDGRARGKLAYYSGRGSLAGWLRAVVSQLAIDQFRKESKFVQIEEAREFENLANDSSEKDENTKIIAHHESPEDILTREQTQKDVAEAIREAMRNLPAEDRLILKLYYFDNLKLKDIGAALGFHEATASRKIARMQTDLRKAVEKSLAQKHGWKQEEVKRFLSETAAGLDLSVEKLLGLLIAASVLQEIFHKGVLM